MTMRKLQPLLPDALIVAGVGAVAYGAWLILPAAGFIVGGAILLTLGIRAATAPAADQKVPE
jgi:hypothetical protein